MNPLVSILIPSYNSEQWISKTIESALEQSWSRLEVVIVDDGSTDETLNIAKKYEGKNVSVNSQKNAGASAARNKAYSICQGDYITWLDADDIMNPIKIERQMLALRERGSSNSVASCNWGHFFYRPKKAIFKKTPLCQDLAPTDWLIRKMGEHEHMQTATWLVSRGTTDAAGPWNGKLISDDDGEYFCRVLLNTDQVIFTPESKVYYRRAGLNSWGSLGQSDRKLEAQWLSMQLHIQYLLSLENSERTLQASIKYLNTWILDFYSTRPDLSNTIKKFALDLGGNINPPHLKSKWKSIELLFGYTRAKYIVQKLRNIRSATMHNWDKAMYSINFGNGTIATDQSEDSYQ
jgi:glycosyltransferase involved in cell wall biosynthesis